MAYREVDIVGDSGSPAATAAGGAERGDRARDRAHAQDDPSLPAGNGAIVNTDFGIVITRFGIVITP